MITNAENRNTRSITYRPCYIRSGALQNFKIRVLFDVCFKLKVNMLCFPQAPFPNSGFVNGFSSPGHYKTGSNSLNLSRPFSRNR